VPQLEDKIGVELSERHTPSAKAPIQFVALLQFLRKMESFDSRNLRNPFQHMGQNSCRNFAFSP
jgi:hypothetical protein